jgi:hypothetical protein
MKLASVESDFQNYRRSTLCFLVLSIAGSAAFGSPLVWTFQNATLIPGGTLSGSFTLDADTQVLSSWDISVTGNSDSLLDVTYTPANSAVALFLASDLFTLVTPPSGALPVGSDLFVAFDNSLTDAGGTITLGRSGAPNPFGFATITEVFPSEDDAAALTGVLSASPASVPEPTTFGVVWAGCAALYLLQQLKSRPRRPIQRLVFPVPAGSCHLRPFAERTHVSGR